MTPSLHYSAGKNFSVLGGGEEAAPDRLLAQRFDEAACALRLSGRRAGSGAGRCAAVPRCNGASSAPSGVRCRRRSRRTPPAARRAARYRPRRAAAQSTSAPCLVRLVVVDAVALAQGIELFGPAGCRRLASCSVHVTRSMVMAPSASRPSSKFRKPRSNAALWMTRASTPMNSRNSSRRRRTAACPEERVEMPCTASASAGTSRSG